jgi:hypothetical protein
VASYVKFFDFIEAVVNKEHNCNADTFNVYLSNTTPDQTADLDKADLAEISTGNGYSGPVDTQNTGAESAGTYTLTGTKVVITASGGSIAAFRYVVLYNDTHATDGLVAYWDYGSALTLNSGETFSIKFNNSDTTGTIFTAA